MQWDLINDPILADLGNRTKQLAQSASKNVPSPSSLSKDAKSIVVNAIRSESRRISFSAVIFFRMVFSFL